MPYRSHLWFILAAATASRAEVVALSEKSNHVTEAITIVDAPPEQIYQRVTDYAHWPSHFGRSYAQRG